MARPKQANPQKRDNILITKESLPSLIGVPRSTIAPFNLGKIENKGYEVEMTYSKSIHRNTINPVFRIVMFVILAVTAASLLLFSDEEAPLPFLQYLFAAAAAAGFLYRRVPPPKR